MFVSQLRRRGSSVLPTTELQQRTAQAVRCMSIYAVGEGWTGALTRRYVRDTIEGHYDEDTTESPALIYGPDDHVQVSAGWGSSALVDTQGTVQVVGRPHDLIQLLRLNRMPDRVRDWVGQHTDPSDTTIVGSMISKLIGMASGGDEDDTWGKAREYSLLHEWTALDTSDIGDKQLSNVCSSAGFMAMIGKSGTLYTMGVNNRGQCGYGEVNNNVWTPSPVMGLSLSNTQRNIGRRDEALVEQDEPMIQMALGFQQGYALSKSGRVFSWGKANRGQLAREVDSDQDAMAGPINFDGPVKEIASGMHHAALLCTDKDDHQVYHWGKNMGRGSNDEEGAAQYSDAVIPEPVMGLPKGIKVLSIACGSHHTAMLMEDGSVYAVGVASDEAVPLLDAVLLIPPGTFSLPVKQFAAHHDRTTIVDSQGQVFQAHLWKDEGLREYSVFTPSYVDSLLDEGLSIESIHRGWLHTLIVTKPN